MMDRIIALVDMDCFYVQVEQRLDPELQGKPCAVVQYNEWQGGAIIAVNYEARDYGVKRPMRGNEAKSLCPDIKLVKVPEIREKADLTRYREAGAEVINVLKEFSDQVERASVDEAYIDLTETVQKFMEEQPSYKVSVDDLESCFVIGWDAEVSTDMDKNTRREESLKMWLKEIYEQPEDYRCDIMLAIGSKIAQQMRAAVYNKTQFRCSAGISHNKMIAKLCCGINKPNKQTACPRSSISHLYSTIPIRKVRGFGGKFGEQVMGKLDVTFMAELSKFKESHLLALFGEKSGKWLFDVARGLEYESVCPRLLPKSVGCSKNFLGPKTLRTKEQVKHWFFMLSQELEERLHKDKEANNRVAKHMSVGITTLDEDRRRVMVSRACPVPIYCASRLHQIAYEAVAKLNHAPANSDAWIPQVINVNISAGKFEDDTGATSSIAKFFSKVAQSQKDNEMNSFFSSYLTKNKSETNEDSTDPDQTFDNALVDQASTSAPRPKKPPSIIDLFNNTDNTEEPMKWHDLDVDEIKDDVLNFLPEDIQLEISKYRTSIKSKEINEIECRVCPDCNKNIKVFDFDEHVNFHAAKKLSDELNGIQTVNVTAAKQTGKRLSGAKKSSKNKKIKKSENKISSYFKSD